MPQLVAIQILRALAALAVAYGHAVHDAGQIAARSGGMFSAPLQAMSVAGVDLFFAISGFVMVLSSAPLFATEGGSRRFIVRRVARIAPIYWLVTFVYLAVMAASPGALNSSAASVRDVLFSLFFIPYQRADSSLVQPVYGLGWTLNYEMFFYALFAVAMSLPMRKAVGVLVTSLVAIALAGWVFQPEAVALRFWSAAIILEFALGALAGAAYLSGWRMGRLAGLALVIGSLVAFFLLNPSGEIPIGWDRLWKVGLPLALLLVGAVFALPGERPALRPLAALGDASYALYLFHPMVIRVLSILWGRLGLAGGWMFIFVALAASSALALLLFRAFERPVTRFLQQLAGEMPRR